MDVEVSRLKLMKADHQSKQYRLEDQLLKYFPEEIEKHKGFIKGFESDLEVLAAHPHPEDGFAGMEIRGDLLTDKENAGAALLDACKEVKTSDPVQIGSYRGYAMSVEFSAWKQEYTLLLKGQMTHRATLGTDPRGNLTRIDNALAQMPQRLEAAKAQLDNLYQQQAAAKEEVGKPFLYEEELRSKNARLVELDTLLNIDGKGQAHTESVVAKSTRPSVLDHLKRPVQPPAVQTRNQNSMRRCDNMNTNDLNTALYEKMAAEQDKFRDWLKSQPPEEILNHTYEYTIREDIVMAMEELELTDAQAQALLESPSPLADVYRYFEKLETGYMDVIRDSIENRADDVCRAKEELRTTPVYPHSAAYAREHGEMAQYNLSYQANSACKEAIEQTISAHYAENRLDTEAAVKDVLEKFGTERVQFILANTIQQEL